QNQRYGSSHIGATAKDISNVVTDAASGVVDIFHGIDKAVADTWNNFWKDGKADGIGSNLSHNLGNLLLLGKIGVFHNRRNASSRLLLLISKHLILCIYLVFRILA